jgi:single-strand DNA-binding protein
MLNEVKLIGRLGKDPELTNTAGGNKFVRFSVATNKKYTDKNGKVQENTEWHRCKAWNKLAEIIANYGTSGRQVYVSGELENGEYTDKDGVKRYTTDVRVTTFQLLDAPSKAKVQPANVSNAQSPQGESTEPQINESFDPFEKM